MGDNTETAINAIATTKPGVRSSQRKPMDRFRT